MPRRLLRSRSATTTFAALVIALVVSGTAPAQGQDDPRQQQQQVRQQASGTAGQIDVLRASAADVQASVAAAQSLVSAAEARLAEAQAAADAARASLDAAVAAEAAAQRQVTERIDQLRATAVDAYVNAGARDAVAVISQEDPRADVDQHTLRLALAGFRADQDELALERLRTAQQQLAAATAAAKAAADETGAREAAAAAEADGLRAERDRQASLAADVERRLDDKLAEAAALRDLDRKLSDRIAAEERALATTVTPPQSPSRPKPPPPPGTVVAPPPPPAHPDLVTTHGITVARSIADQLGRMIDAAAAAGINLTGHGYRDYDSQVALRKQNCGTTDYDIYQRPPSECTPPTARPGQSNHERGLAVDFASNGSAITSHDDPAWIWLSRNAATYGFVNLDSEPWHWSVDGR